MSCLKIPNLNLFRGKRENRVNQLAHLQQKGMKLIKAGNNKQLIDQMQAELYLENYRANLKHFVSPTKVKEQAEKYLKENKFTDEVYLKAMQLPRQRKFCPNCFDQYLKINKQCYCELQQKIPLIYRSKSPNNYYKPDKYSRQVYETYRQIKKIEIIPQQKPYVQKKQEQIASNDFILTQSEVPKNQLNSSVQNDNFIIKQQSSTINNRVIPDSSIFLKEMRKREVYLQNINMQIGDSRAVEVDFQGLAQARSNSWIYIGQYVNKSNQILDRLNEIIRNNQN